MAAEKSKNIFENSKEGTIGARIRVLLEKTGLSVSGFEEDYGLGNGTLKSWKDESIEKSTNTIKNFLRSNRINEVWWKTGKGDVFNTSVQKEAAITGKPLGGDPEVYRIIVEGNTEYVLVKRSLLEDSELISKKQLSATLDKMAKDMRIMEIIVAENVKLTEKLLTTSEPKLPAPQIGKENA